MDMNVLGSIVRRERRSLRLTQKKLGEFSGTGLNFISQLERGKQTVRLDKLLAVLNILGIELSIGRGKNGIVLGKEFRQ